MKAPLFMTLSSSLLLIAVLTFSGCDNTAADDGEIDPSFILQKSDTLIKGSDLMELKMLADLRPPRNTESTKSNPPAFEDSKVVNLKNEVAQLFDPENHPCKVPDKIAKKLRKLKSDGKQWAPSYVVSHISEMPDSVIYIPRQSISNVLHWIFVKRNGGGTAIPILITGAPTYNDLVVEDFILSGYANFFYSLDCSGYLNAAIEGAATVPGADIKTAAKAALETQSTMFIGGGVIISPLCAAYYGDKVAMDTATRIKILNAMIHAIPSAADNDVIDIDLSFDAVWASKTGGSSLNGKAELKSSGALGIGVASISSSLNGGGSISRKSSFSSFNTYITGKRPLNHPEPITVAKVKAVIQALTRS